MKVFISIDIEGISGVFAVKQADELGSHEWREACRLMRGDLDAALAGCDDAGVDEVVVCDDHYDADNLSPDGLPDHVALISGRGPGMMEGLDGTFDAALLIGYHAMAGTMAGVLAHTYSDRVARVEVVDPASGKRFATGELGLNGALAGAFGVPVVATTGDDKLAAEAQSMIPDIGAAIVKQGISRTTARLLPPTVAHTAIRETVAGALQADKRPAPLDWSGRSLEVAFGRTDWCDGGAGCPHIERLDGVTIRITGRDYPGVFQAFCAAVALSQV